MRSEFKGMLSVDEVTGAEEMVPHFLMISVHLLSKTCWISPSFLAVSTENKETMITVTGLFQLCGTGDPVGFIDTCLVGVRDNCGHVCFHGDNCPVHWRTAPGGCLLSGISRRDLRQLILGESNLVAADKRYNHAGD